MKIVIKGGAGYVGSIVTQKLLEADNTVIVLDNLQQGHKAAILSGIEFIEGDICDIQLLESIFQQRKFDAVVHMAAETVVEFSMTDPKRYFNNNVIGGINLLNAMIKHGVKKMVFSSSASVYGEPQKIPMDELHPREPINSYGESKLMFENILKWYGKAYNLKHISFRYFNAAGATNVLGEDHRPETHLIPNILKAAIDNNKPVSIFGTDYPTKDGSCIRDYVHVVDIARAHIIALNTIEKVSNQAFNLGNGEGFSVLEVVKTAEKITGQKIPFKICPRRSGDPAVLLATPQRAFSQLGWKPEFPKLESIIESAWFWTKEHPFGYGQ
jgi:UDP-glucose 4-epimerase